MNLIGADRPLEDVKSKEAETRVEVPPVKRDVFPGHAGYQRRSSGRGVGTSSGAGDVGHAGDAVEIGDRARLAGARWKHVEQLGARLNGWIPPGIGRGSPACLAASAGPAAITCPPRNPAAPRPAPAVRNWRRLGPCRWPGSSGRTATGEERIATIATP